jgi:hypothetical protein
MTHDDDTCPHLVRYAMMWNKNEDGSIYVSPWPSALSGDWVKYEDYALLKAEVERLTKAGDAMVSEWASGEEKDGQNFLKALVIWNAAKEGKQP